MDYEVGELLGFSKAEVVPHSALQEGEGCVIVKIAVPSGRMAGLLELAAAVAIISCWVRESFRHLNRSQKYSSTWTRASLSRIWVSSFSYNREVDQKEWLLAQGLQLLAEEVNFEGVLVPVYHLVVLEVYFCHWNF